MLPPSSPHIEDAEDTEAEVKLGIAFGLVALAVAFCVGFKLESWKVDWLPESSAAVLIGFCASLIVIVEDDPDAALMSVFRFDMQFFMDWLVPPIIFEAALNMNVGAFVSNLRPTLLFAFAGTLFSTFVVAGVVFVGGQLGICYSLGPLASLTFGSLISATDPVAVLATFQALGVHPSLFSIVFGESVLNDAVAIVLYKTLTSFTHEEASVHAIVVALGSFVKIFCGSMLIGLLLGACSALTFKHLRLRDHEETVFYEVVLSFTFPWTAYFLAEAYELSGIVSILFAGMVVAVYTRVNLSVEGLQLMAGTYKCIAKIAETFVFVYLGMACVRMAKIGLFAGTTWRLFLLALLGCFVGRTHIFLGSWFFNRNQVQEGSFRSSPSGDDSDASSVQRTIPRSHQLIMWLSGLRGGVAFAIAASSWKQGDFPQKCGGSALGEVAMVDCRSEHVADDSTAILQITMLIAVFTTCVLGGSMPYVARWLQVVVVQTPPQSSPSMAAAFGTSGSSSPTLSGAMPSSSALKGLDNKAAPLLESSTTTGGVAATLSSGLVTTSPGGSSAPTPGPPGPQLGAQVTAVVEHSHSWLVRFLTHEENYTYLADEQPGTADRFIGRGSIFAAPGGVPRSFSDERSGHTPSSQRPAPLRRHSTHGSIPSLPTSYEPPPVPSTTRRNL
jgi:sodium/hydrogen exchanger 8